MITNAATTNSPLAGHSPADEQFCRQMLPQVSRTFALTIRLLPPQLGYTVTVAYLLCRIADTIEDTSQAAAASRVALLAVLRKCLGDASAPSDKLASAFASGSHADRVLVRNADKVLREYWKLPSDERVAIRPSVEEMCDGMARYIVLLESRAGEKQSLESMKELEDYCYIVAGTVGHLLTRLFTLHFGKGHQQTSRRERMWSLSTRFALGLQLTNIVQDIAADSERGVVYVPRELTATEGPSFSARPSTGAIRELMRRAHVCLGEAIDYCTCVPRTQYRIRLFCLLAPYLAVRTLSAVHSQLKAGQTQAKAKISRGAVYRTVAMTFLVAPSNTLLRAYFAGLSRSVTF